MTLELHTLVKYLHDGIISNNPDVYITWYIRQPFRHADLSTLLDAAKLHIRHTISDGLCHRYAYYTMAYIYI